MTSTTVPDLMAVLDTERAARRSPVTRPGYNKGRRPANKGRRTRPDPLPTHVVAQLLEACVPLKDGPTYELSALRLKCLIVVLWRTGMRISEALALTEHDLHIDTRTVHIAHGKGNKARDVALDAWGWAYIQPWLLARATLPPGELFCVLVGPTAGRAMSANDARRQCRWLEKRSGVRHRIHPHQFRHTCASDMRDAGEDWLTIQTQLGHAHIGVTQVYFRGIPNTKILEPLKQRRAPMMPVPLPSVPG